MSAFDSSDPVDVFAEEHLQQRMGGAQTKWGNAIVDQNKAADDYLKSINQPGGSAAYQQQMTGLGQAQNQMQAQALGRGASGGNERAALYAGANAQAQVVGQAGATRAQENMAARQAQINARQFGAQQYNAQTTTAMQQQQMLWDLEKFDRGNTTDAGQTFGNAAQGVGTAVAGAAMLSDARLKRHVEDIGYDVDEAAAYLAKQAQKQREKRPMSDKKGKSLSKASSDEMYDKLEGDLSEDKATHPSWASSRQPISKARADEMYQGIDDQEEMDRYIDSRMRREGGDPERMLRTDPVGYERGAVRIMQRTPGGRAWAPGKTVPADTERVLGGDRGSEAPWSEHLAAARQRASVRSEMGQGAVSPDEARRLQSGPSDPGMPEALRPQSRPFPSDWRDSPRPAPERYVPSNMRDRFLSDENSKAQIRAYKDENDMLRRSLEKMQRTPPASAGSDAEPRPSRVTDEPSGTEFSMPARGPAQFRMDDSAGFAHVTSPSGAVPRTRVETRAPRYIHESTGGETTLSPEGEGRFRAAPEWPIDDRPASDPTPVWDLDDPRQVALLQRGSGARSR